MDKDYRSDSFEIIGIAGNIGAGKSVVSRILRCNGFAVYDCDREASILMNEDAELRKLLTEILGEECYLNDGRLNKKHVADMIFTYEKMRMKVNSAVHSAVKKDFLKMAVAHAGKVFVESAIMAESGLDMLCNKVWVVDASEQTRLGRVMVRSNLSEKEVLDRMESQKHELSRLPSEKVVVIPNENDSPLLERVLSLAFGNVESISCEIPLRDR